MVQGTTNQAIRGGQTSGLLGDAEKDNTNYNQQSDMSRKEDFKKAADDYVEGEPDGAQKIVGQVGFEFGAEYGFQYAIEKACEWLENNAYLYVNDIDQINESALIGDFRGVMED